MDLFKLASKIVLDTKDFDKGIDEAHGKTNKLKGAVEKASHAIGPGLKTAAKIGGVALGAIKTGFVFVAKKAVEGYAEFEQLVGGVETLFGAGGKNLSEYAKSTGQSIGEAIGKYDELMNAQQIVMSNSAEAYKTAGLSQNEYIKTVTGFSAALIQSLEGDTVKAAETADLAITDMSDNANKMGTSMESIQYAYQGFAKQNYTMLDNLKLGYGGTKEEMKRLLDDAEKLTEKKYDLSSYADIVEAIHAVQTEMGITGTTALEASTTIEGSVNSMKAAWGNLVVGIADENANIYNLISEFVESVGVAAGNVLDRVDVALDGAGQLVETLMPVIMDKFPTIISENLPKLLKSGVNVIKEFLKGISDNTDLLVQTVIDLIDIFTSSAIELIPLIVTTGADLLVGLIEGIAEDPESLIDTVLQLILTITGAFYDNLPKIVTAGFKLIGSLIGAIIKKLPDIFSTGIKIIGKIKDGIVNSLGGIKEKGGEVIDKIKDGISGAWEGLKSWVKGKWNSLFDLNIPKPKWPWGGSDGSHAGGLSYVPYDNYVAQLHRGERVLTAQEAKEYNKGGKTEKNLTVINNIYAPKASAAEVQAEAMWQAKREAAGFV